MTRMAPRRPVTATAVFLVAMFLFGGIAGLAQAGDGEPDADSFRTVAPQEGERGSYTAVATGAWAEGGEEPFVFLSFEWTGDETVRARDGAEIGVHRVDVASHLFQDGFGSSEATWVPFEQPMRFDPATGRSVELMWTMASQRDSSAGTPVPLAGSTMESETFLQYTVPLEEQRWRRDCMFRHPFQADADEGPARAICRIPGIGWVLGDMNVVGLEHDADFGQVLHARYATDQGHQSLDLWYAPGFSVPVRFAYTGFLGGGLEAVLTGHEPGTAALSGPVPHGPPLPPVGLEPRAAGLDDPDHPYPLAQVFQDAAGWEPYAEYRGAHPEADVYQASVTKQENDWGVSWQWQVTLADGGDRFGFSAERPEPRLGTPLPFVEDATLSEIDTRYLPPAPEPGSLPDQVPVLEDLFAWHDAFLGERPRAWSFLLGCIPHEFIDGCAEGSVSVGTNDVRLSWTDYYVPGGDPGLSFTSEGLTFGQDGKLSSLATVNLSFGHTPNAYRAVVGDDKQQDPPAAAAVGGFWSPPTAEQAAGAGLLALVLAGLYYFWPSIKALPFLGGFSRLKKDELEEHPARAAIMEAVRAEPGLHFQEIRRRTGLANGTAVHHIGQLEAKGLLATRKASGHTCYFARGEVGRDEMDAASVVRSPGARRVLHAVRDWPGASNKDLAGVTGLSPATVSHHVKRLGEAGIVSVARGPRGLRVEAA